jgi:GT2 family glycosyltransferase
MKTAIIIPTWNKSELLVKCLKSLEAVKSANKIYVVDNGSTDDTVVKVNKLEDDRIQLVKNSTNLGFAGGVNAGIFCALEDGHDAVVLLNNDAIAQPDWLDELIKLSKKGYGIVGSVILDETGNKIDTVGDYMTSWGLMQVLGRDQSVGEVKINPEPFAVCGGAMLIKREVVEKIGYFDEDLFAYYEDVDFCYRARHAGFKVGLAEKAVVHHAQGSTSKGMKGFTTYQTMKNLEMVQVKNAPFWLLVRTLPRLELATALFFSRAVTRGDFVPALKGVLKLSSLLPKKMFVERRAILKNSKLTRPELEKLIVWDLPQNAGPLRGVRRVLSLGSR